MATASLCGGQEPLLPRQSLGGRPEGIWGRARGLAGRGNRDGRCGVEAKIKRILRKLVALAVGELDAPEVHHDGVREPAGLVEVIGSIKWFDAGKGFGFIVPDNGLADVLLHVTCLRRDGFQTAYEGARVVCEVLQRPKGLQAFRILSMDETTAVHPAQMPPPRTHVTVTPTSGLERAQVKWFNRLRGFGFLSRGEGTLGALIIDPTVYENLKKLLGGADRSFILRSLIRRSIEKGKEE